MHKLFAFYSLHLDYKAKKITLHHDVTSFAIRRPKAYNLTWKGWLDLDQLLETTKTQMKYKPGHNKNVGKGAANAGTHTHI